MSHTQKPANNKRPR